MTGCGWNCQDVSRVLCFKFLKYIPSRQIYQATIMLEKYFSQYFINLRLLTSISIHKCSGNNVCPTKHYKQQQNKIKVSYLKQASCYFSF